MLWFLQGLVAFLFFAAVAILIARIVFVLPAVSDRNNSVFLEPPEHAPLVQSITRQMQDHPDKTGVLPLPGGSDAFAARMMLADAAVSSIDLQYYIWRGDLTGSLLLDALKRAAERGVRVRLLLDDNGTAGLDSELAALDAHENAQVRFYNPFNLRRFKTLSYGFDFFRLNRRMHNKSFTVDGTVTILGGRNIGNEYFDFGTTAIFVDLDVLAVGKVVPQVSADFDRYWASQAVRPIAALVGAPPSGDPIAQRAAQYQGDPQMVAYTQEIASSKRVSELRTGTLDLEWTDAVLVSDDPIKGLGAVPRKDLLSSRLRHAVGRIDARFDGITAYFVPSRAGVRAFSILGARGVKVRMLTNSLEATDVLAVHAGYTKRRRKLLRAGVGLFELQRQAAAMTPKRKFHPFGSAGASLHAKTFAIDGARIFIGSFNFDPRSDTLNTEMGLLIDSPTMATQMHDAFDQKMAGTAWQVTLEDGNLIWRDNAAGKASNREPGASLRRTAALKVIGWLPVEWLL